ncbi:hypothetical protein B0I37DRAFT_368115 [Chaetomium sp. MPI-CAGE-AT-0009]|nr:hypothetical protein B0I37DRAFT_368115 [Chaetomium sp. MPI-CAGE-AT-0009]
MTSICNYSDPELQITDGLERHSAGTLFPYNPEFYERASGLYGPGSILTWYILLASTIIHWLSAPRDDEGYRLPGMSTDLLAVVAYPVFAATDLLVQAIRLVGTEYRALAILCLRIPMLDLHDLGDIKFNHTQLNLAEIPPGIVSLGQRVVEITGPLAVCYVFTDVSFLLAISLALDYGVEMAPWRPSAAAKIYLGGAYAYVSLVLVIFHFSLGDIGTSIKISCYEASQPALIVSVFAITLGFGGCAVFTFGLCIQGFIRRDWTTVREFATLFGLCASCAVLGGFLIASIVSHWTPLVPDLGVTIDERDQLAAVTAGTMTLVYTVYRVIRDRRQQPEVTETELCELEGLTAAVELPA